MKVLNVAEKPSMSRQLSSILSSNSFDTVKHHKGADALLWVVDEWKEQVLQEFQVCIYAGWAALGDGDDFGAWTCDGDGFRARVC